MSLGVTLIAITRDRAQVAGGGSLQVGKSGSTRANKKLKRVAKRTTFVQSNGAAVVGLLFLSCGGDVFQ